ncbi:MAG TPA: DUF190 domain-containing protein [Bacteroidota bacterium]|nr:DUF190 domain-containing protein [Bacteroidota bacterium]
MIQVQMFFDEDDRYDDVPMYEYLMRYLIHHEIRGATLFAAMGGFGAKHHLHFPKKFGAADEGPLMLLFIDTEEKVAKVLPHLKIVLHQGLLVTLNVEVH